MKKRLFAIMMAATMAIATGCASGSTTSTTAAAAAETTKAGDTAAAEAADAQETVAVETAAQADIDAAAADNYGFPKGTITWVVAGKAGGGSDLATRYLSEAMTKELGITNTVTNFDSNTVGHQNVANEQPDGSTIMLATGALNIQWITGNADVNPKTDLTLIAALDDNGFTALCAPVNAPYNTFDEMIEYAKQNPGKLNAGMPSSGNNTFQFGKLQQAEGIQLNAVEASSESDRLTNLAGGFIDLGFVGIGNAQEYEKAGKLKVLGTMAGDGIVIADYDASLGDQYKTLQEQGHEDLFWNVKHYVYGPAGMDEAQVQKINAAMSVLESNAACNAGLRSIGHVPEWHNVEDSIAIRDEEYAAEVAVGEFLGKKVND